MFITEYFHIGRRLNLWASKEFVGDNMPVRLSEISDLSGLSDGQS
jgi:hypothetical protein